MEKREKSLLLENKLAGKKTSSIFGGKINHRLLAVIAVATLYLYLTGIDSYKLAEANISNDSKLSGNITLTYNLDNGTVLSIREKPLDVICAPGSVWDELFGCE